MKIDTIEFSKLLKNVYLDGTIKKCVINLNKNMALVQSMNPENSLFICHHATIGQDLKGKHKIGIADLALLNKLVDGVLKCEAEYVIGKKWFTIKAATKGNAKVLLTAPEEIITNVEEEDAKENVLSSVFHMIKLHGGIIKNLIYYLKLFKSSTVILIVEKGQVNIKSNTKETNQFEVNVGQIENVEDMKIEVDGKSFLAVLNHIQDQEDIFLKFDEECPIVIEVNNFLFALSPISE